MQNLALDPSPNNTIAEPAAMFIHYPSATEAHPWSDWAESIASELVSKWNFRERRFGCCVHLLNPLMGDLT
jgi:hypothetical protein